MRVPSFKAGIHVGLHHKVHAEVWGGDLQHLALLVPPLLEPPSVAAYCRKCSWPGKRSELQLIISDNVQFFVPESVLVYATCGGRKEVKA